MVISCTTQFFSKLNCHKIKSGSSETFLDVANQKMLCNFHFFYFLLFFDVGLLSVTDLVRVCDIRMISQLKRFLSLIFLIIPHWWNAIGLSSYKKQVLIFVCSLLLAIAPVIISHVYIFGLVVTVF